MQSVLLKKKSRMPRITVDERKSKIARLPIVDNDPITKGWLTSIPENDGYEVDW